ncbi:MAG TPA: choice-of-anchor Q domain-containing protein [Roseiflexaceae bacterium]
MNRRTATSLFARLRALALALALLLTPLLSLAPARMALAASPILVSDCSGQTGPGRIGTVIGSATAGDTIQVSCSGTIPISSTLTISQNLTLDGSGQTVTLDGGNSVGVLLVNSGVSFTLNALTIAHGLGSGLGAGGGLANNGGTVNISNSTFSDNAAGAGGGLANNGGTVNINNSTFSDNAAGAGGGLANNGGTVNINNSTFANNLGDISAGGLFSRGGTVNINNSTFANNRVVTPGPGSGLFNAGGTVMSISNSTFVGNSFRGFFNAGTLTISNSTVVGNSSEGLLNNGGTVNISNSTVVGNGSVGLFNNDGTLTIGGSIVANNAGGNCVNDGGTVTSQGYNLESGSDCGFTGTGDLQNTDPKLAAALASNGGATQTLALLDGSPAINKIPASACALSTDQRGIARPQGPACDIGAFEFRVPKLSLPGAITVNATSPQGAMVSYTATASEPDDASATPTLSCSPASGSTFPIGTTTVTCTASDAANPPDMTTGSFQVLVKGAAAQVNDLITLVNSLHLSGSLQNALDNKLRDVLTAINAGQTATACSELTDFIGFVQSHTGKGITQSQASQLITAARQVQAVLGC